jgi:rhamnosyltransferase
VGSAPSVKSHSPTASVIVRTRNSAQTLASCLRSLEQQTVVPEIIVVDSGSSDRTLDIANGHADEILEIPPAEFTYGRALNRGAEISRAPVLFALSSHCSLPRPDWIERSLNHYDRPKVAGTNGQIARPDGSPLREVLFLTSATPLPNPMWGFSNHASSWRADLWREQPFDEGLIAAEDFEWADRVTARGFTLVFDPALVVPGHHLKGQGVRALYRRSRRELLGIATFRRVEPPTVRQSLSRWWHFPPGTKPHRQWLSPYRIAVITGRYTAGRQLTRRARA